MKEYGIIFSKPMVLALIAKRKRVTRRLAPQWLKLKVGDVLWVRETLEERDDGWHYRADGLAIEFPSDDPRVPAMLTWAHHNVRSVCTAIHMPRWASRILLRVTEPPRLERVQDITEDDAKLEGVEPRESWETPVGDWCYRDGFEDLWRVLHTKPGQRWTDNPENVRIAFEPVEVPA